MDHSTVVSGSYGAFSISKNIINVNIIKFSFVRNIKLMLRPNYCYKNLFMRAPEILGAKTNVNKR